MKIIDFHTHPYPMPKANPKLGALRQLIRKNLTPAIEAEHRAFALLNKVPARAFPIICRSLDQI